MSKWYWVAAALVATGVATVPRAARSTQEPARGPADDGQSGANASKPSQPTARGQQFLAMIAEWLAAVETARIESRKAGEAVEQRTAAFARLKPDPNNYGRRFLAFAEADPQDEAARDALLWIILRSATTERAVALPRSLAISPSSDIVGRAVDLLIAHHSNDPDLPRTLLALGSYHSSNRDRLFRELHDRAHDRITKGTATLALGTYLLYKAGMARVLQSQKNPVRFRSVSEAYEKELRTCDFLVMRIEALKLLERVATEYRDIPLVHGGGMIEVAGERGLKAQMERGIARKLTLGEEADALLDEIHNLAAGKPAPEIDGVDFDGKPLKLSDYRGKVVLVVFWATWCGPCMAEVPHERELAERLKQKPFALLGVNCDADKGAARKVMERERMVWPNWYDGDMEDGPISKRYHVQGLPKFFVLDTKGIIRANGGGLRGKALDEFVDKILGPTHEQN